MLDSFNSIVIIDWYDNILKAICQNKNDVYYCSLLAIDKPTDVKIYVCIDVKYFTAQKKISSLLKKGISNASWNDLRECFLDLNSINESWVIKTNDLKQNHLKITKYKDNFNWNSGILFCDFPEVLDKAKVLDDWWGY